MAIRNHSQDGTKKRAGVVNKIPIRTDLSRTAPKIGSVTITQLRREIDALEGDVLLVLSFPVERDDVFDGSEVQVLVLIGNSILNVVEVEVVFAGGGDRRA
jgi:hypothetical protein